MTNVEHAKAYFLMWGCNSYEMSRDGGAYYSSYRKIATDELENQWKQEYFEQSVAVIKMPNNQSLSVGCKYSDAVGLLRSKKQTKEDIEITTIDQAKEYFIRYNCNRSRMKYDLKIIAESYLNFAADDFEKQWTQEAFERNIMSIKNKEYAAKDYPFYDAMVSLFENDICSAINSKILLDASKDIKAMTKDYNYFKYARAILEHVIPALFKLRLINEARDFIRFAGDLIVSNSNQSRDWQFHDTVKKYEEWIDKLGNRALEV